jgi:hypothetical protein
VNAIGLTLWHCGTVVLNDFPGPLIQLIGVIKARGDLSAVAKRKDVDARIRS